MNSQFKKKPRVVVADDYEDALREVITILKRDYEVVASAKNGLEAIGAVVQYQPEVLISDIHMPMMDGIRAARHLRMMHDPVKIVLISESSDPELASAAISTKAGFVMKSRMATDLGLAISEALADRQFVSEVIDSELLSLALPPCFPAHEALVG